MAIKKPLVLNGGQIQQLQTGDYVNTVGLFDPTTNLGGINGLATNGLTVHNGTAFTTVSLTAPVSGMTITNANGIGGSPTFAFTGELAQLIALTTGIVVKTNTGTLAARTIQGTSNQISVVNGTGVAGNPTIAIASNVVLPGTGSVTVPMGTTAEQPLGSAGMIRYNTTTNIFEFYENGAWINYGTSDTVGTVTSVDVALPTSVFSASSGAITTSGTISFTLNTQTANTVFAGPSTGVATTPTFRALVAADIPNLDWSKITTGKPTTLAGYGITDAVPNTRTVSAGTGLTGGGALTANVTISMPNVGTAVVDQFRKITTDAQGRVSATSAVGASDITTALGYTPVNKAGDTMNTSANLVFTNGGVPTGLPSVAVNPTDAVSKAYVDNLVTSSTTWRDPVFAPNLIGVVTTAPSATVSRTQWIAYGGTYPQTWGTVTDVAQNDILEYDPVTTLWTRIGTLTSGQRFVVAGEESSIAVHASLVNAEIRRMDLIQYVSGNPTLAASWSQPHYDHEQAVMFTTAVTAATATGLVAGTTYTATVKVNVTSYPISFLGSDAATIGTLITAINTDLGSAAAASIVAGHLHITGAGATDKVLITDGTLFAAITNFKEIRGGVEPGTTVLVSNELSADQGRTGYFSGGVTGSHSWIEIGGPSAINAGVGLAYSGNIMNVNLGAGITELPSDEVGIHLYAPSLGALILTQDGTTRSTHKDAGLHLLLDGTSLTQSATGVKVAAGGITATELNSSVAGDGLLGGAGTALSVNVDNSTLEINTDVVRVKASGITASHLATSVAGNGLLGGGGTALSVNVGTGPLEIVTDVLGIKTAGVTNAMLANSLVNLAGGTGTGTVSLGGTLTFTGGTGISTSITGSTATITLNAALNDLTDVAITAPASGHILYHNGTAFVNAVTGAASGVQPYDATLSALATLNTTAGIVVQTGTDTFTKRTITGTAGRVAVTNGDGVAGNPTIDLASGVVTAGTYSSVTVDTYGRVIAGSTIEANTQVSMVNANAGSLVIGTPVYVINVGSVDKADAGATSTTRAVGLVSDLSISTGLAGNVAVAGILTATTGQWDAITGQVGGLTSGATYFLSGGTPGTLTTTPPSGVGEYIAPIGIALSTTKFKIAIDPTIQL